MGIFGGAQSNVGASDDRDKRAHVQRMQDEIQITESELKKRIHIHDQAVAAKTRLAAESKELEKKTSHTDDLIKKLQHELDDAKLLVKNLERNLSTANEERRDLGREHDRLTTHIRENDTETDREFREITSLEAELKHQKQELQRQS